MVWKASDPVTRLMTEFFNPKSAKKKICNFKFKNTAVVVVVERVVIVYVVSTRMILKR